MNLIAHSVASKGALAFLLRTGMIAWRFQLSSAKAERNLGAYLATLRRHGYSATFPITAVVLRRHQALVRYLDDEGIEFAVHGYVHTDHTTLSATEQREQIARALDVFAAAGVSADGFRGPYLRHNQDTVAAAQSLGFRYVSNQAVWYDVLEKQRFGAARWTSYQKALNFYSALPSAQTIVRPHLRCDLIEIPVAMPDDEILVDRLGIHDRSQLGEIWTKLLEQSHQRGDIFTLQLHPERGGLCHEALSSVLAVAEEMSPAVWITQLRDVATWWRRRSGFRLRVEPAGDGWWMVSGDADPDATILVKNATCPQAEPWCGGYLAMNGCAGAVESPVRPTIGVSRRSEELRDLLLEEGYAVIQDVAPSECAIYFDRPWQLTMAEQAAILESIEGSSAPLVRFARWPDGARSAMCITGDVDALTLGDFVSRTWEVI